jgi:hypothetical protein
MGIKNGSFLLPDFFLYLCPDGRNLPAGFHKPLLKTGNFLFPEFRGNRIPRNVDFSLEKGEERPMSDSRRTGNSLE